MGKSAALNKKVAFFVYDYILSESPTIVYSALELAKNGFQVDIFYNKRIDDRNVFTNDNISIKFPPMPSGSEGMKFDIAVGVHENRTGGLVHKAKQAIKSAMPSVILKIMYCFFSLYHRIFASFNFYYGEIKFIRQIKGIINKDYYDCFIAVEPEGLLPCTYFSIRHKVPLIYFSLELNNLSWDKKRPLFKFFERLGNKRAICTIIQDEERAGILLKDNRVEDQEVIILPVSARGAAYRKKSNYLREKLGIPEDKKIVLYAGCISGWAMCVELAEASSKWNEEFVLVLHGPRHEKDCLERLMPYTEDGRVRLSLDWVPYGELDALISSGDVGIALYRGDVLNNRLIGAASSKFAQYLKCGIPIITNDYSSIRKVINKYKCGECIADISESGIAIEEIFGNYLTYSKGAYECYEKRYNFSSNFKPVIDKLSTL
ncbi:MAG: hypothetical protein OEV42_02740 [Deltaproteobacteria bacterium]|nr:hypothetical protein [Deltaproteobacteria bacterium]